MSNSTSHGSHSRRPGIARAAALLALAVSVSTLTACGDWFTTFARQPAIHTWQVATMDSARIDSVPPRGNPQGSVPLYGSDLPEWVVSRGPFAFILDSMAAMLV